MKLISLCIHWKHLGARKWGLNINRSGCYKHKPKWRSTRPNGTHNHDKLAISLHLLCVYLGHLHAKEYLEISWEVVYINRRSHEGLVSSCETGICCSSVRQKVEAGTTTKPWTDTHTSQAPGWKKQISCLDIPAKWQMIQGQNIAACQPSWESEEHQQWWPQYKLAEAGVAVPPAQSSILTLQCQTGEDWIHCTMLHQQCSHQCWQCSSKSQVLADAQATASFFYDVALSRAKIHSFKIFASRQILVYQPQSRGLVFFNSKWIPVLTHPGW